MPLPSLQVNPSDSSERADLPVYYLEQARADELSKLLIEIQRRNWTIGSFFRDVLAIPAPGREECRSDCHTGMVGQFLRGRTTHKPDLIVEMMYSHQYSKPKVPCNSKNRTASEARAHQRKREVMAQGLLEKWAVRKVEDVVSSEADQMSSTEGGFHLPDSEGTWASMLSFSLTDILSAAEFHVPILLRLLLCAAFPAKTRPRPQPISIPSGDTPGSHSQHPGSPSMRERNNSEAGATQEGSERNSLEEGHERSGTQEDHKRAGMQEGRERDGTHQGRERDGTHQGREHSGTQEDHEHGGTQDECERDGTREDHERGGTQDERERDGTREDHERGGMQDEREHGGTREEHERGGTQDDHKRGGTQDERERGGTQDERERDGTRDDHECGGTREDHERGGTQERREHDSMQQGRERGNVHVGRERDDAQIGRERDGTQMRHEHDGTQERREHDGTQEGLEHDGTQQGQKRNRKQRGRKHDRVPNASKKVNTEPPQSYANYFSKPPPAGSGKNRRDPFTILLVALMLLMHARNLQFSAFCKLMGVWLFAQTVPHSVYAVLSRIGFSSSYTSVLKFLRALSKSAQSNLRETAKLRAFLLIYDNINRMFRAWDPDLGQKDTIHNGTAATFVELEDCNPEKAFDPEPLHHAHQEQRRSQLTHDTLLKRLDQKKLQSLLALHCLSFLVEEVPSLEPHRQFIQLRFRTSLAIHRMRKGRKTKFHPLATSDYNEGNTAENAKVLHDLLITQLGLSEEEVAKLLTMVGGDQSTVEKLRMLKKIAASCPHGYSNYNWVLPVIQLWHMGWSDLERIINTHWGSEIRDISSFCSTNTIMGQKVKNGKRPDYYPAQHLVFDSLKVEILDCWRKLLGQDNLEQYFEKNMIPIEDLLSHADKLVHRYCSMAGYVQALYPDESLREYFSEGKQWKRAKSDESPIDSLLEGDQVLANAILRRRDSLIHYEFHYAIADGDIGRAMNVMAVWVFTFAGSGRHKYTNELLELVCNFEFEYSPELQEAILNNWLCNLSGIEGCWFPDDLLEEKDIGQLKKMATRKDATFGGSFYRQIVSINVRAYLDTIATVASAFGLGEKGGTHRRVKKEAANKELRRHIEDEGLNTFRKGRTSGHIAQDDWTAGDMCLHDGKRIKDFIMRTLRDAGDIHDPEEASITTHEDEAYLVQSRPLPNVLIDGLLVQGDEMYDDENITEQEIELVDYICEDGSTMFEDIGGEEEF